MNPQFQSASFPRNIFTGVQNGTVSTWRHKYDAAANGEVRAARIRIQGWGGNCSPTSPFRKLSFRGDVIELAENADRNS